MRSVAQDVKTCPSLSWCIWERVALLYMSRREEGPEIRPGFWRRMITSSAEHRPIASCHAFEAFEKLPADTAVAVGVFCDMKACAGACAA